MDDLARLKAYVELSEAKARYCRYLDTKNWDAYRDLMTEDYELDVSEGTQTPIIRGRDAAIAQVQASILTAKTAHQVHSPEITFFDGEEAHVIWAMQDRVVWGPDRSLTGYGHYHDRWVRRDGEWKLAALKLTRLHLDFQASAQG